MHAMQDGAFLESVGFGGGSVIKRARSVRKLFLMRVLMFLIKYTSINTHVHFLQKKILLERKKFYFCPPKVVHAGRTYIDHNTNAININIMISYTTGQGSVYVDPDL